MFQDELLLETPRFRVVRRQFRLPGGTPHFREIIQHPGAVLILPVLDDGRIGLISNYRAAVDETLLELPAGTLEVGEDPQAAAHRELAEETGWQAGRMDYLFDFYMSPGILHERMYFYVARELRSGAPRLEAGEQIQPRPMTLDAALELCSTGKIRDAKTLVALLHYARSVGA